MNKYYAHSKENEPPTNWQPLEEHLVNVAKLARNFAEDFGAGDWGYLAGLWHDLGKYSKEFQGRLLDAQDADAHIETKTRRLYLCLCRYRWNHNNNVGETWRK